MAETHEWMFYEVTWRQWARGNYPLPWWCQQYFRAWSDDYDGGLFSSKEAAFCSNAHYRYWHMIGVKDHHQESLIGQAGEIEPVYDHYAVSFFLFDPQSRTLHLPQFPRGGGAARPLEQGQENGFLPIVRTVYRPLLPLEVTAEAHATTLGMRQRSVVVLRFQVRATAASTPAWLCVAVTPAGPTGFQRHDKAGRYTADKRIGLLSYDAANRLVEVNSKWGPIFATAPNQIGLYGNEAGSYNPDDYLANSPFRDLAQSGVLNGRQSATDHIAGLCTGVFAWTVPALPAGGNFNIDVYLPVDDYRGDDIAAFHNADPNTLVANNRAFWSNKLNTEGLQPEFPSHVDHLGHLFRLCRANLLILADDGEIHPGPTIYDSFWVRDSSVEGIACALAGDMDLPRTQFGVHYPTVFNRQHQQWGPVDLYGFFGGEHEKNDYEWDSNGQALWAIGRMDRILGAGQNFGLGLYWPYMVEGARWLRDNRSQYGLLHSGWSAEHIGDKGQPHFWDDLWGLAGLWEAAQLATRINAREIQEIWNAYDSLRRGTIDSIRWVLSEQRRRGFWETFVPTGPGDVGRLDSTMIGAVAYFHPCRLYMGAKLSDDIDYAFRMTLETIWNHFIDGGFRHDSAWYCYGPYLTLQLAHAFLLIGDVERMDRLLAWSVGNAGYAKIARNSGRQGDFWEVALGAWNEQHCYPIAKDFGEVPHRWWYMGDIPHGWASAELILLLRDILFFEAAEDSSPHIYLAPGVMSHWLAGNGSIGVTSAPTVLGGNFGYRLTLDETAKQVTITISQTPPGNPWYVYPCRFGSVVAATSNAGVAQIIGRNVQLPAGTTSATIRYA
ncbi:MAG: hypothetical protein U1F76_08830 [Candidatus Competibacteraceae bacterium]